MNILKGHIDCIKVNGDLSVVKVRVGSSVFSTILIDTPETAPSSSDRHHRGQVLSQTSARCSRQVRGPAGSW